MAIAFVGVGVQDAQGTATVTAAFPAAYTPTTNDLGIIVVTGKNLTTATDPTAPTGWTQRGSVERSGGTRFLRMVVFWRVIQSGDAAPTIAMPADWSNTTGGGMTAQMLVYSGVDTSTPFDTADVTGSAAAAATWTPAAITTATANAMVVVAVGSNDDNALSLSTPQSFNDRASGASYDSTVGGDFAVALADLIKATAGAVTMPTFTQTLVGNDVWVGITMALKASTATAVNIPLAAGALDMTGFAPSISKSVPLAAGALALTGFSPAITKSIPLGVGALVLTGFPLTITTGNLVPLDVGALLMTGFAPAVTKTVPLGAGALLMAGLAPRITKTVPLAAGALLLTGFPLTISTTASANIPLGLGELAITGYEITIEVTGTPVEEAPVGGGYRVLYAAEEPYKAKKRKRKEPPEAKSLPELPPAPEPEVRTPPRPLVRPKPVKIPTGPPEDDEEEILFLLHVLVDLD